MKNVPLFLVILLINLFSLNAQELKFGIKAGLNYNNIGKLYHIGTANGGGIGVIPSEDKNYNSKQELSYHFGTFLNISFKKIFLRPEINFTTLKKSYPLSQKTSYWNSTKLDIPILLGFQINNTFSIYSGPVFSKISTMKLDGVQYPILFKKSKINLHAGVLVNFGRFGIDARYEYGMAPTKFQRIDIIRAIYGTNVAHLLEYNHSQIIISIQIALFKINTNERHKIDNKSWRGKNRNCTNQ